LEDVDSFFFLVRDRGRLFRFLYFVLLQILLEIGKFFSAFFGV